MDIKSPFNFLFSSSLGFQKINPTSVPLHLGKSKMTTPQWRGETFLYYFCVCLFFFLLFFAIRDHPRM